MWGGGRAKFGGSSKRESLQLMVFYVFAQYQEDTLVQE